MNITGVECLKVVVAQLMGSDERHHPPSQTHRLRRVLTFLLLAAIALFGLIQIITFIWRKPVSATFPLTLAWQVDLGRSTYERPTYHDHLVLMPADGFFNSQWYGIDAETGKTIWSQPTEGYTYLRCLLADDLVVSGWGSLFVLEPQTGKIIWLGTNRDGYGDIAACSDHRLFTGASRSPLLTFDLSTGLPLWNTRDLGFNLSDPVYNAQANEVIVTQTSDGDGILHTLDADTGRLKRSFEEVGTPPYETLRGAMYVIDQGQLFVGETVLEATTGRIIHQGDPYSSFVPPMVMADTVYFSHLHKGIILYDRTTFQVKTIYQPNRNERWFRLIPLSSVTILNEVGYVIFSDATLRAFDVRTGKEIGYWQPKSMTPWQWPTCLNPEVFNCKWPIVGLTASQDRLFVSFGDGTLYAFRQSAS